MLGLLGALVLTGCSGDEDSADSTADLETIDPLPAAQGLMPSLSRSNATFNSVHFAGNAVCAECHDDPEAGTLAATMYVSEDSGERDLSINRAWETSVMANASRDPYWQAVVAYEMHNYPQYESVISETCTRCHAPMMNVMMKREERDIHLFSIGSEGEEGFIRGIYDMQGVFPDTDENGNEYVPSEQERAEAEIFNHAMDGISCSFCHQLDPKDLGEPETMTGNYHIAEFTEETLDQRPAYGPIADPDQGYMLQNSDHLALYGEHMSKSEVCATCHNLNVKPFDKEGNPVEMDGHFAEQAPYTEWEQSAFAEGQPEEASCQSCHMPVVEGAVPVATSGGGYAREGFSEHSFLGANTVIQQIMHDNKEALGIDPALDFTASINANREFLQTSADVSILWDEIVVENDRDILEFAVLVENHAGHKLPTAYHSRRAWLHVVVTDANGQTVYENGRMNPDGSIVGLDEDVNTQLIEPHYDVVNDETEVQVYQSVAGNSDGERAHSVLNNSFYMKDNRLLPRGFNKSEAHADTPVAGAAWEDANFVAGEDRVIYRVPLSGTAPWNVAVNFRYQALGYGHLFDLFRKSEVIPQVDMLRTMFDALEQKDELLARHSISVDQP